MRKSMILLLLVATALAAYGKEPGQKYPYVDDEMAAIGKEYGTTVVGTLTVADTEEIAGRISIALQKERYVARSRAASMIIPGIGQFMNDDPASGTLFVGADVALLAGTLMGGYFLLPENVRLDKLDYFNTPLGDIEAAWESNTLLEYLPTIGVSVGGSILMMILRHVSAAHAEDLAATSIAEGKVTFEPVFSSFGFMKGFGMGMRMRY